MARAQPLVALMGASSKSHASSCPFWRHFACGWTKTGRTDIGIRPRTP